MKRTEEIVIVRRFELEIGHQSGPHWLPSIAPTERNGRVDFPRVDSSGQSIRHYFDVSSGDSMREKVLGRDLSLHDEINPSVH